MTDKHYSNYLRLFEMQLHGVLEDMAGPADNLSLIFSESLVNLHELKKELHDYDKEMQEHILSRVQHIIGVLQDCITNMQFVDSKRQRIEHVADGLSQMNKLVKRNIKTNEKYSWDELDSNITKQYKMEREREIYNKFLQECEEERDSGKYLAV